MLKVVIGFMFGMNILTVLLLLMVLGSVADARREMVAWEQELVTAFEGLAEDFEEVNRLRLREVEAVEGLVEAQREMVAVERELLEELKNE